MWELLPVSRREFLSVGGCRKMSGPVLDNVFSQELAFALDICEQAGRVASRYFSQGVETVTKEDGTPVTRADKECEQLIRSAIQARYPQDAMMGEEEGETKGGGRRWIIDPIDGTYGFARGSPIFSVLLALEEDEDIVMGVVHAPAMKDTYWAEKNKGAYLNGKRIHVSDIGDLSQSQFNFGGINRIFNGGFKEGFSEIVRRTAKQRAPGDYLSFALVFEGKAEASLEVGVKPWDLAPMKILASEAGGRYTDLQGGGSIYQGSCLVSNGRVHDEILKTLLSA